MVARTLVSAASRLVSTFFGAPAPGGFDWLAQDIQMNLDAAA